MPPLPNYDNAKTVAAKKLKNPEEKISYELANDFVNFKLGNGNRLNSKTAGLLRKLGTQIEEKHEPLFKNMCNRLDLHERSAAQTFCQVADEILGNEINWGRIVVLYTFGGRVALYFKEQDLDMSEEIATWIGTCMSGRSEWIRKAGGWEAFHEQFKDVQEENEKFWWNSLLCTTLGLGTIAAVLYAKS